MTDKKRSFFSFLNKTYISLNIKLAIVIAMAAVVSVIILLLCILLENVLLSQVISSEKEKIHQVSDYYIELQTYIDENDVKGTDSNTLELWIGEKKYTGITVYNDEGSLFSAGWSDGTGILTSSSSDSYEKNLRQPGTREDAFNRTVQFTDGSYYVYMNVYPEAAWQRATGIINIGIVIFVFFLIVLSYNKDMLSRISRLSADVRVISDVDLDHTIVATGKDELGNLAESVESMRLSIKERIVSEQQARDANTQLITSMSHDIRTPLTSLIGYLDIINSGRYSTEEELQKYINSCKDKAIQLKDLSDKLFQYFLVFSDNAPDRENESMDAGILFRQLLLEQIAEIISTDGGTMGAISEVDGASVVSENLSPDGGKLDIKIQYNIPDGTFTEVDLSAIKRIFDNIFSNIKKYANTAFPVVIKASVVNEKIELVFQNHIWEEAKKVESTKIGVKTCKYLCDGMGANFYAMEEEKIYTTRILFTVSHTVAEDPETGEETAE